MSPDNTAARAEFDDRFSVAKNMIWGGGIGFLVGLCWTLLGWAYNGEPDFFSYCVLVTGAVCAWIGGWRALRLVIDAAR